MRVLLDEKSKIAVKLLNVEKFNNSLQANSKANIGIKSSTLPMYPTGNHSLTKTSYIFKQYQTFSKRILKWVMKNCTFSYPKTLLTCILIPILLHGQNLFLQQLSNIYNDNASVPALCDASSKKVTV